MTSGRFPVGGPFYKRPRSASLSVARLHRDGRFDLGRRKTTKSRRLPAALLSERRDQIVLIVGRAYLYCDPGPENVFLSTVRSADPPAYRRRRRGSAVDPFEPQIRELPKDCNRMPATVIAERIGWTRGILILRECVAELRPRISIRIRISAPTIVPASSRNGTFMVSCGGDPVLASDRVAA